MPRPDQDEKAGSYAPSEAEAMNASDSEDEVGRASYAATPRGSLDRRTHDQETLYAEEEAEGLLRSGGRGGTTAASGDKRHGLFGASHLRRKGRRRSRRGTEKELEASELMFQVEDGPRLSGESSSGSMSETDSQQLNAAQPRSKKSKWQKYGWFAALQVGIIVAFLLLLYGAFWASKARPLLAYEPVTASNGTHTFLPTTILISLDGFRADFLHRNVTPNLSRFLQQGVSPKYMLPSFPSLTFPNHFTIATGLHPESHGIVGNNFYAPDLDRDFYYTDPDRSMQPEWWAAEPIWVRAEKAGIRTAIHMWPGSEAGIGDVELAWVDKYDGKEQLGSKVDRIMWWLDRPGPKYGPGLKMQDVAKGHERGMRPQLVAAYVPNVDSDGHRYGPNSTQVRDTIMAADEMIGGVMRGIEERNLTSIVNVIVVSDHGMATTDKTRLFQLEDLVDVDLIAHMDTWPLFGLRFKNESEIQLQQVYEQISSRLKQAKYKGKLDVYIREDMPERFHFSKNAGGRIAPLWLIPRTGYAIVTKQEYNLALMDSDKHVGTNMNDDRSYAPRGLHGYDNQHPLMRAIFAARGPAFPHEPGSELEPFQNIEVYNMVCDSLAIAPRDNNGTMRLPLSPIGVHRFPLPLDLPDDPALNHAVEDEAASDGAGVEGDGNGDGDSNAEGFVEQGSQPERPEIKDGKEDHAKEVKIESWLDWVHDKVENIKDWAKSSFGGHSENEGG